MRPLSLRFELNISKGKCFYMLDTDPYDKNELTRLPVIFKYDLFDASDDFEDVNHYISFLCGFYIVYKNIIDNLISENFTVTFKKEKLTIPQFFERILFKEVKNKNGVLPKAFSLCMNDEYFMSLNLCSSNIVRFNDDQIKKYLISLVTWIDILLGGKEKEEGDINFLKCIGSPVCVSN